MEAQNAVSALATSAHRVTFLTNGQDILTAWDGPEGPASAPRLDQALAALPDRPGWQIPGATEGTAVDWAPLVRRAVQGAQQELAANPAPEAMQWLVVTAQDSWLVSHPAADQPLPPPNAPHLVIGIGHRRFVELDETQLTPVQDRLQALVQKGLRDPLAGSHRTPDGLCNPDPGDGTPTRLLTLPRYHLFGLQTTGQQGAFTIVDRWNETPLTQQAHAFVAEGQRMQPGNPVVGHLVQQAETALVPQRIEGRNWTVFARPLTSVEPGPLPPEAEWFRHPGVQPVLDREDRRFRQRLEPAPPPPTAVKTPTPAAAPVRRAPPQPAPSKLGW